MSLVLDPRLTAPLDAYARRRRAILCIRGLCKLIALTLASFGLVAICDYVWVLGETTRWSLSAIAYGLTLAAAMQWVLRPWLKRPGYVTLAQQVEHGVPHLRHHLQSAVELSLESEQGPTHDSAQFRSMVRHRVARALQSVAVGHLLPWHLVQRWVIATSVLVLLVLGAILLPGSPLGQLLARAAFPGANLARVSQTEIAILAPDHDLRWVPAEEPLDVVAAIRSRRDPSVMLEIEHTQTAPTQAANAKPRQQALTMRPDPEQQPGRFLAQLPVGEHPLRFRVRAADGITAWQRLEPRARPGFERFEFELTPPEYSGLPDRTLTHETADAVVLQGTHIRLTAIANQPLRSLETRWQWDAIAERDDGASDPLLASDLESRGEPPRAERYQQDSYRLETTVDRSANFSFAMESLETGFINRLPPRYRWRMIEDRAPQVTLARRGMSSAFSSPSDVLVWDASLGDELDGVQLQLQWSVNDGSLHDVDIDWETTAEESQSGSEPYRWAATAVGTMDLRPLDLTNGDLLRVQLRARDRKGQVSTSDPVSLRIAGDEFAANRHEYLRGRLQVLNLLPKALSDDDAAGGDSTEAARAFPLLSATNDWLLQRAEDPTDRIESELLGRYLADAGAIENRLPTEKAVEAWRHMVGHSAVEAFARDLLALRNEVDSLLRRYQNEPEAWVTRRSELLVAACRDCVSQLDAVRDSLDPPLNRELQALSRSYEDQSLTLEDALSEPPPRRRLISHLKNLQQSWNGRSRHLVFEGGVPLRSSEAVKSYLRSIQPLASRIGTLRQTIETIDSLRVEQTNADDATRRTELASQLSESRQRLDNEARATQISLQAAVRLHRLRDDFSPQRIADLQLADAAIEITLNQFRIAAANQREGIVDAPPIRNGGEKASDAEAAETPPRTFPEHLRAIQTAVATLEAGHEAQAILMVWRPLAIDERWGQGALLRCVTIPRRLDYVDRLIESAAQSVRQSPVDNELADQLDQWRWQDPADEVKRIIGRRRWDPDPAVVAADDLALMDSRLAGVLDQLEAPMEAARRVLRRYVPTAEASQDSQLVNAPDARAAADSESEENAGRDEEISNLANSDASPEDQLSENDELPSLEQLTAAAREMAASPEALLRALEQELQRNQPMQQSLSEISEQILRQAEGMVADAAERENQLRRKMESEDAELDHQKSLQAERLQNLGQQAEAARRHLMDQARSLASQGSVDAAQAVLSNATRQLQEAASQATQANNRQLAEELETTGRQLEEALRAAQEASVEAAKVSAEAQQTAIQQNQVARQQTLNRVRGELQRNRDQRVREAENRRRRLESAQKAQQRDEDRDQNNLRQAEKRLERARQRLSSEPDNQGLQREARAAEQEIGRSRQGVEHHRAMAETLEQMKKQAAAEQDRLRGQKLPELQAENPSAEAAATLSREAVDQFGMLAEQAQQLQREIGTRDGLPGSLSVKPSVARNAAETQQDIGRQMNQAAESLRRAARHEDRLGAAATAEALNAAAEQIRSLAEEEVSEADRRATAVGQSEDSEQDQSSDGLPLAASVNQAEQAMQRTLENLQSFASPSPSAAGSPSAGSPPTGSSATGSPAGQPASNGSANSTESPAASESAAADGPSPGSGSPETAGSTGDTSPASKSQSAPSANSSSQAGAAAQLLSRWPGFQSADAKARLLDDLDRAVHQQGTGESPGESLLLAEAEQSIAQAQARQQTNGQGQPSEGGSPANMPGPLSPYPQSPLPAFAGNGQPNGSDAAAAQGGNLPAPRNAEANAASGQWGRLRERRAEDVSASEQSTLPLKHRRQIETYFRALAERTGAERTGAPGPGTTGETP